VIKVTLVEIILFGASIAKYAFWKNTAGKSLTKRVGR
jgi:hypothetical protein